MRFIIQTKSDLVTGTTLIVSMPEDELDKKALYTIQADKPNFLLPFHYRSIDGKIEFIYQIGPHSKLQYLTGNRLSKDYAELWSCVLSPLLNCDDWFMKPYSFFLSAEYLYYDKKNKTVRYVYVPSVSDCSDQSDLKEMAAEVSKMIAVSDASVENKILLAIMKNFDPRSFLQMLNSYSAESNPVAPAANAAAPAGGASPAPEPASLALHTQLAASHVPIASDMARPNAASAELSGAPGDIIIDLPVKEEKKTVGLSGLFANKKNAQPSPSVLAGNAVPGPHIENAPGIPQSTVTPVCHSPADFSDETQSILIGASAARLCCVGRTSLPPVIDVLIDESEFFSIGRFDAAVGKQQSSFEFDRKTKAVSRRHAVIERGAEGYSVTDLASNAGTFVNGHKLPPNTRCKLESGCRVSFGNSGADYVWEE